MNKESGPPRCSFCGKSPDEVNRLIAGPDGVFICDECVRLCEHILSQEVTTSDFHIESIPTPREIQKYLDDPLAEEILRGQYAGDLDLIIGAEPDSDKLTFKFNTHRATPERETVG